MKISKMKLKKAQVRINFLQILNRCRDIILNEKPAHNILRYLLFTMQNSVISSQFNRKKEQNTELSNLYFDWGSISFDRIPFKFFPIKHKTKLSTLIDCINFKKELHESQLLARVIENKTRSEGIFIDFKSLFSDDVSIDYIKKLVNDYNALLLCEKHKDESSLKIYDNNIYINGIFNDCVYILDKLIKISKTDFNLEVKEDEFEYMRCDCNEKKEVLNKIFKNSNLCVIYGAAGTGKSTLLGYISKLSFFENKTKIFLAQTNSAVDNLKRRIKDNNSEFMTIKKFEELDFKCELLVVDECSIVSNEDFKKILSKKISIS